jgi:Flp pilus assembly protein TadG
MMRTIWKRRSQRGSNMVEFALIAPILIFLVLSVPVFGLITRSWLVISGAARDAARAAALYGVTNRAQTARDTAVRTVSSNLPAGPGNEYFKGEPDVLVALEGSSISVTVTYRQPTFVPLLGRLLSPSAGSLGDVMVLRSKATFHVEGS